MKTFDEQIREMQAERHRNEWWERRRRLARGEDIWVRFVAWCYGEGNGEWEVEPKRFADYLKANGIELDFWKRKAIAENTLANAMSGMEKSGRLRNEKLY